MTAGGTAPRLVCPRCGRAVRATTADPYGMGGGAAPVRYFYLRRHKDGSAWCPQASARLPSLPASDAPAPSCPTRPLDPGSVQTFLT
jgi:hypothetical protein